MWWGRSTLHWLWPSSSWLIATLLGSKGQNKKISDTSVVSSLNILVSSETDDRGSEEEKTT